MGCGQTKEKSIKISPTSSWKTISTTSVRDISYLSNSDSEKITSSNDYVELYCLLDHDVAIKHIKNFAMTINEELSILFDCYEYIRELKHADGIGAEYIEILCEKICIQYIRNNQLSKLINIFQDDTIDYDKLFGNHSFLKNEEDGYKMYIWLHNDILFAMYTIIFKKFKNSPNLEFY